MLFNSINFLIFFPIVTILYFILPCKIKQFWLLVASYYFYMSWNLKYGVLLLTYTIIGYVIARILGYIQNNPSKKKQGIFGAKGLLAIGIAICLLLLFCFKYLAFISSIFERSLRLIGISYNNPDFSIVLPVGISFFAFQSMGYIIDVYRGDVAVEKDFVKYALFISFFPQLIAGPIERAANMFSQFSHPKAFSWKDFREGFLIMLWGYYLKLVLADRIAIVVDTVYSDINMYQGWYIVIATMLFAIQIYCDFAGYSTIAIGASRILGINLMENFNSPYMSKSVAEFWRRWHMSLTTWFRDYVYIPLGGSHKGNARKHINRIVVFLLSGIWHGAGVHFLIWGGINGLYISLGEALLPVKNKLIRILNLNPKTLAFRVSQVILTFLFVDFAWLFFRAESMSKAIGMLKSIFVSNNIWILFDGSLCCNVGLSEKEYWFMLINIVLLAVVDYLKISGKNIRDVILRQDFIARYLIIAFSVVYILVFGVWGPGFNENSFIYFQF